jgi:ABC-type antimicrobial peptide transport system permease subunit
MASSRFDPGFRTADTVVIDIVNEPKRVAMLQAIASDSTISAHAAVRPGMLAWPYHAYAELGGTKTPVAYKFVSPEYFDVFAIAILQGRTFTTAEASGGPPAVIVSESMARKLWPGGRAVGETIRIEQDFGDGPAPTDEPTLQARVVTVVGVSRDVAGFRITDVKQPDMFLPTSVNAPNTSIAARVNGDPSLARSTLIDHLTRVDSNMGAIVTMRTVEGLETFFLKVAFWVALVLGGLALLLTVSGLFSVLSYLVEQRTREIGVRMALGASSGRVAQLILGQTMRPVCCGLLAGAGLAASLATILLAMPVGEMIGQVVHVTDPVAYGGSLLLIVAGCLLAAWIPAARAARLDPMRTLRRE